MDPRWNSRASGCLGAYKSLGSAYAKEGQRYQQWRLLTMAAGRTRAQAQAALAAGLSCPGDQKKAPLEKARYASLSTPFPGLSSPSPSPHPFPPSRSPPHSLFFGFGGSAHVHYLGPSVRKGVRRAFCGFFGSRRIRMRRIG